MMDLEILETQNGLKSTKTWTIYKHISPSGKEYVGITSRINVKKRWCKGSSYGNCRIFLAAIQKYGWNNFQHIVIATGLGEKTAKNMEKDLIAYNKAKGISYNITDGGDGHLGVHHTIPEEKRKEWSKQRKGRVITKEWRKKLSEALKGRVIPKDVCRKGGQAAAALSSRPVLKLSVDGEIICEYPSIKEAARQMGISSDRDIIRCCRNERRTRCGYKWKYKNE